MSEQRKLFWAGFWAWVGTLFGCLFIWIGSLAVAEGGVIAGVIGLGMIFSAWSEYGNYRRYHGL